MGRVRPGPAPDLRSLRARPSTDRATARRARGRRRVRAARPSGSPQWGRAGRVGGPPGGDRRLSNRSLALILNPSSAGGKALRALPAARTELTALGLEHRVIETRDIAHAAHPATEAASAGEVVVA